MSNLDELAADILEDNIIDADEVDQLRDVIYDDDVVDREEANLLFQLNDETDVEDNDDTWGEFFVEALASHVLEDEESPGVIDEEEASWLIDRIEGDGQVDANEFALLLHIADNAEGAVDSLTDFTLESAKAAFLADGIIDEEEVAQIKTIIYGSGGSSGQFVDRSEANFLFDLNDAVTGKDNADGWSELFVEAIGNHLMEDEESPGVVDGDEAEWLIERIEGDDEYDATEKALLGHLQENAEELDQTLEFKLDLHQID